MCGSRAAVPALCFEQVVGRCHFDPEMDGSPPSFLAISRSKWHFRVLFLWPVDHLGSPYETILYLFLCLPRKLGGYGLPKPVANQPIAPKSREAHLVAQHNFYPDLFWPDKQLIVEYDSFKHHSTPKKTEHDARRRNDLESIGYRVMIANRSIVSSAALFSQFADNVRRELGMRSRPETAHCRDSRMQLRRLLLAPDSIAELWR